MKKEIAEKWIEALESGEYQQGRRTLRTPNNRFCCLGVLCDLYSKETGAEWSVHPIPSALAASDGFVFLGTNAALPSEVRRWAGIEWHNGGYLKDDVQRCLAEDNDRGATFKEIAGIIREQVDTL